MVHLMVCILVIGGFAVPVAFAREPQQASASDILTVAERDWLTKNQSRIVLAVETGYAPFVFRDAAGLTAGLAHEHMTLLQAKLGVRFAQKAYASLQESFASIRSGEAHLINAVTPTPARKEFLDFTAAYISVPNKIIVRKEREGTMTERDLAGLTVSLVRSYAVTEHLTGRFAKFEPRVNALIEFDDLNALTDVAFSVSDAAVIDMATASWLIQSKGITNLRAAGDVGFNINLAIGCARSEPILCAIMEKGLAAITVSERQEIRDRWINISGDRFLGYGYAKVIGGVSVVALLIAVLLLFWNRALRLQVALRTTELRQEQEALQERELHCRALIDAIPDLIFEHSPEGEYLAVHAADPALLLVPKESLLHRRILEVMPSPLGEQLMDAFAAAIASGQVQTLSYVLTMEGKERHFFARIVLGAEKTLITIVRDVTDQKHADAEWQKYARFFTSAFDLMCIAGTDGYFKTVNPSFTDVLGYTQEELLSRPFMEFIHPADRESTQAEVARQLQGSLTMDFDNRYLCKDGTVCWLSWRARFVPDDGLVYASARDISVSKRLEQELVHKHHQLEDSERRIDERTDQLRAVAVQLNTAEKRERQSIAMELHDELNQVLAIAQLKLSILMNECGTRPEYELRQKLEAISALINLADDTVRSLSWRTSPSFGHALGLEAGLVALADHLWQTFGLRVALRGSGLNTRLPDDIVTTIFRGVREALMNVVRHAHVDSAEVVTLRQDKHLLISVIDRGAGFMASNADHVSKMSGYGIFGVRERMTTIGGDLQIDSTPGDGTVVVLSVPLSMELFPEQSQETS